MKTEDLTWESANQLIADNTKEVASAELCREPLVSVLVLSYNHAEFIRRALDSVLEQETDLPFEIVVGEDCSTDGTREIVQAYQEAHPQKFRLLQSTNRLGKVTNSGRLNILRLLRSARGRYVALLESDDYWCDSQKLARQIGFLEANRGYSGAFHETRMTYSNSDRDDHDWWYDYHGRLDFCFDDTIDPLPLFHTSSFVFRKECLPSRFPDWYFIVPSGDMVLFNLVSRHGRLRRVEGVMSMYRRHEGGVTSTTPWHAGCGTAINRIYMYSRLQEYHGRQSSRRFGEVISESEKRLAAKIAKRWSVRAGIDVLNLHYRLNGARALMRTVRHLPYAVGRRAGRRTAAWVGNKLRRVARSEGSQAP